VYTAFLPANWTLKNTNQMGGIVTPEGPTSFGGTGGKIASFAINLISGLSLKSIRDRAKAKKAQAIANSGGYNTLTPYQKSLISGNAGGTYDTTPEKAGLTLDLTSILIFVALAGGVLFLIFRRRL